nr:hypothetical protein [Asaia astilbis]
MNRAPARDDTSFPVARLRLVCDLASDLAKRPALAVEEGLRATLRESRKDDAARGATTAGAHRADLLLQDALTGREASLSSSGQQKAMLVHVILNHAALTAEKAGSAPLILLDEPLNHLDAIKREALLRVVQERAVTALMTGTDEESFGVLRATAEYCRIEAGRFVA